MGARVFVAPRCYPTDPSKVFWFKRAACALARFLRQEDEFFVHYRRRLKDDD
jgi:hypothetical protein